MNKKTGDKKMIKKAVSGSLIFVISAIIEVTLLALLLQKIRISGEAIRWITQFLKVSALLIACLISVKKDKGLLTGGFIGLTGSILLLVVFSVFGVEKFKITSFCLELAFCTVVGAILGILIVNVKAK